MRVNPQLSIEQIIEYYPGARQVLAWHQVDIDRAGPGTSLATACRVQAIDIEELMEDLLFSMQYDGVGSEIPLDAVSAPTLDHPDS
jgi:hypothetical protein